ncbi:MAG: hypothetical protein AAFV43_17075, partial [Planctomycetota bacterium]
QRRLPEALPIAAIGGDDSGLDALSDRVRTAVLGETREVTLRVPMRESKTISQLESRGEVIERDYSPEGDALLRVRVGAKLLEHLRIASPGLRVIEGAEPAPIGTGWKPPASS